MIIDLIGIGGFVLSLVTLVITRIERRKKLTIDLSCHYIEYLDSDDHGEDRVVVIEVINQGSRAISLDTSTLIINLNGYNVQYGLDWIGKEHLQNPLNPGQNHRFGVLLDVLVDMAKIEERHSGTHQIKAELKDLNKKRYKTRRKFSLVLDVDEIERE